MNFLNLLIHFILNITFYFILSHTISLDLNNLVFATVKNALVYSFPLEKICQGRKFQGKFTYLAFLDLKKAYDSVPIFNKKKNILTKLYRYGVHGKCFDFLCNLYTSSKACAQFASILSNEFHNKRCVRQGCPLSRILFNLFINDILNDCEKYGVNIGRKKCCGGPFADEVVLIAPSAKNLEKLL